MDDDYCISPSNRQFLYNRETSTRCSEEDIKEEDEVDVHLTDNEKSKLESCLEQIKQKVGSINLSRTELINMALIHHCDPEKTVNAILSNTSVKQVEAAKDKGDFNLLNRPFI